VDELLVRYVRAGQVIHERSGLYDVRLGDAIGAIAAALVRVADLDAAPENQVTQEGSLIWKRSRKTSSQPSRTRRSGNAASTPVSPTSSILAEVVELVRSVPHTEAMIHAAWSMTQSRTLKRRSSRSKRSSGRKLQAWSRCSPTSVGTADGNRAVRKAIDREHLAKASPAAKTIKLADLISNSRSILQHDPKFAAVYLAEKRLLLEVLKDGDPTLWSQAYAIVNNAR
jgi:hypothetical protein